MCRRSFPGVSVVLVLAVLNSIAFGYEADPPNWEDQNDYSIVQGEPNVDGVISPGEWDAAEWINIGGNVYGGGTWPNCDPNDLNNVMWANMWSPETNLIYVAVQGTDTSHNFGTYVSWNTQDDLEVYVDAGQSNLSGYDSNFRYGQHYFLGPDGVGGDWVYLDDQPADALMPGGYAVGVDGNVITYEFAITPYEELDLVTPGNSVIKTLQSGDLIGLDVCMVTADESDITTFMCEHSYPTGLWRYAAYMLDLTLVGAMSRAYNESPSDGQTGVDTSVVLSWKPGQYAAFHDVYFGTDYDDVNDANTSDSTGIYRDTIDVNNWPVGETLDIGRTYYWRIDEVNESDPCSPWKGVVWSFTVYIMGSWTFECPRSEVAPEHWQDSGVLYDGQPTLALAGGGKSYAIGKWVQTLSVSPNTNYEFTTYFRTQDVQDIWQCILSRVYWQNASGGDIGEHGSNVEFPPIKRAPMPGDLYQTPEGWYVMTGKYKSPGTAAKAKLELYYRFDGDGVVHYGGTELVAIPAPPPRKVKVGTVFYRATGPTTASNLTQYCEKVADAAALGADIVCLPEGMTSINTGQSSVEASESVPGPSTNYLGIFAAYYGIYIVGDVFERVGEAVYNTAVLIDPNGDLVGTFRKTCLPREETDAGVAPGDSYPVFDTDFGRIGMMICWDSQFPLPARMLTLGGAEIIFFPNWGETRECTIARCIENQVYIVSSTNSLNHDSVVLSRQGEVIVQASTSEPVVVTELDLDQREYLWWIGDYRHRRLREMPFQRSSDIFRTADLNGDKKVNMPDFAVFANRWLIENSF